MAVMGILAPLAGMIKVRFGEKADIDSPFFKVSHSMPRFNIYKLKIYFNFKLFSDNNISNPKKR